MLTIIINDNRYIDIDMQNYYLYAQKMNFQIPSLQESIGEKIMLKKLIIAAVLISFVFTGCAPVAFIGGAAVGVGGYKYYNSSLIVIYKAPFDKTWDASISALEELEYQIYERKRKMTSGKIVTTGSVNEKIKLSVKYVSLEETEVTIKVGLMGDEVISSKIKDKIGDIMFNKNVAEKEL